jgi:hypothetical protein
VLARAEEGNVMKRWHANEAYALLYSDTPQQETFPPVVLAPTAADEGAPVGQVILAWVDLR